MTEESKRIANYDIDPIFLKRWSPRSLTAEPISHEELLTGYEAARWAPSGGNTQPWRFIHSHQGDKTWPLFVEFLQEGNRVWAKNASALIVLLSKKDFVWNDQISESSSYSLDAGAAWMSFALQMYKSGWHTHGMSGYDKHKVRRDLEVPENYNIEMMIAVGKRNDPDALPDGLRTREKLNQRQALENIYNEGSFKEDWRA